MGYKVKVEHPDLPHGVELGVAGFPVTLVNYRTVHVTDEQVAEYEATGDRKFEEAAGNVFGATVTKDDDKKGDDK